MAFNISITDTEINTGVKCVLIHTHTHTQSDTHTQSLALPIKDNSTQKHS